MSSSIGGLSTMTGKEARKAIAISAGIASAAYLLYKTLKAPTVQRFKMAKGVPFFGIGLEIEGGKHLYRVMERYADEIGDEGVYETSIFGERYLIVCSWEEAKKVLEPRPSKVRRLQKFDNIKEWADGVFFAEGSRWRRMRHLTAPAFHAKAVENNLPDIADVIHQVGERAAELCSGADGKINITPLMKHATSAVLVKALTGSDVFSSGEVRAMTEQVDAFFGVLQHRFVLPPYWKIPILGDMLPGTRVCKQMLKMAEDLVETMGDNKEGKTLLSKMMEAQDGEKLTPEDLIGNVITLFTAGTDTTAVTATWALYQLAKRPELQDRIAAEASAAAASGAPMSSQVERMKLTWAVWKETLRLFSPAPFLGFTTLTEVELAGRAVPTGTNMFILLRNCVNKSPDVKRILGDDLHEWKPDRWFDGNGNLHEIPPINTLMFGYGARVCLGKSLADNEGILLISQVCRNIRMEPPDYDVQDITNFTNCPDRDIVVSAKKR